MKRLIVLILLSAFVAACGSSSSDTTESSTASVSRAMVTKKSALDTMADQVTTAHKQSVLTLFQGMFNAAPGADLCNLGASLLASGVTEIQLAEMLVATDVFQSESFYPSRLTSTEFASRFITNLTGSTLSATNKSLLISQLAAILDAGSWSRGQAMWLLTSLLSTIPSADPNWGAAATQLNNRLNVSYYYSITLGLSSSNMTVLQEATASVTGDLTTVTSAKETISASVPTVSRFHVATSGVSQDAAASDTNILFGIESHNTTKIIGAQLADFNGSLVGSFISTGRTGIATSVAFDGANYLLIWEDDGNGTYTGDTGWQIYGQLISKAGQRVGEPFAISSMGVWFDGMKAVAYANGRYLATYTKLIDPAMGDHSENRYVVGQLLATDGSKVGVEFRISTGNGQQPSVGTDGTNFIVAWPEDIGDTEIRARIVSSGGALGAELSVNASTYPSDNPISIAFDGTNYFMVWHEEVSPDMWQLYGQKVTTSGTLSGGVIAIATNGVADQIIGTVACGGNNCLVTWVDATNATDWNMYGQYVALDGTLSGSKFIVNDDSASQMGGVSYVNGGYFLVMNSGVVMGEHGAVTAGDVYGAFLQ